MNKQDFIDRLRMALNGRVSPGLVMDNVNYYEDYINTEIRKGRTEEEVLESLGDPRLIARTILQVDEKKAEEPYQEATVYTEEDGTYREDSTEREYTDPFTGAHVEVHRMTAGDWAKIVLVIVIICIVLGMVFHILWKLLPVLLVIAAVLWIYRKITER